MASNTRIKVNKDALIERIKARQSEAQDAYALALLEHGRNERTFKARMVKYLADLSKAVKADEISPADVLNRSAWYSDDRLSIPQVPHKPSVPNDYAHAIGQLEIAAEETITITGDDYARFLR